MVSIKEIMHAEVKPALGCTEPAAVALTAARAGRELRNRNAITKIEVLASTNVYKNGMFVGVPGTEGLKGNAIAAALGALGGDSDLELESLLHCQPSHLETALHLVQAGKVVVKCDYERSGVFIRVDIYGEDETTSCTIEHGHAQITEVMRNSKVVYHSPEGQLVGERIKQFFLETPFDDMFDLLDTLDEEDIVFLLKGAQMNMRIAEEGLLLNPETELAVGECLKHLKPSQTNLGERVRMYCCAASDARMAGVRLPVMSSFGSGNQGIVVTLPLILIGEEGGKSELEIARAILVSHLVSGYLKSRLGKISAFCGCTISAGAGAVAGIVFLLGGSLSQIRLGVQTMLSNTAGMICDGAKENCSFKVGIGVYEAYLTALLSLKNRGVRPPEGIVGTCFDGTIRNLMNLNVPCTDRLIIKIMEAGASSTRS